MPPFYKCTLFWGAVYICNVHFGGWVSDVLERSRAERSKQLEQEARENREKAGKLQTDLEIARQEKGTPAVGCNTHKILEIVERIDEVKKIPTFNDTVYEIDRNTLDMWVKRLKDELKR